MAKKPLQLISNAPISDENTADSDAILQRREALMRKLRRNATAMAGVVLSASACPCLEAVPCLSQVPDCPDANLPDGGKADVDTSFCEPRQPRTDAGGANHDAGVDLDAGRRDTE